MGESRRDRCQLLRELATLDPHPESVPINLLVAVEGDVDLIDRDDRRQQRCDRNAIADAHRDVADNSVRRRGHRVVVQLHLLRRHGLL